jgi:NitT/TauT family transport system substrate-binding protein
MKTGLTLLLIAVLIIPLILTACGGKEEAAKIRIGEVTRSIFYAPQYAALTKGFFKDEGLDVELTTTWGGDKTMATLLSGGIDIALVGSETTIYVYQQGSDDPVINFAQLTQTDGTFLVSRKPIENFTWDMLKGSTFLGQRKGGMPQMAGEFAVKKHGIDPHKDLNLIQNVDFANIPSAFASGTGDFVQLFEPTASVFEKEGKGYVLGSFGVESGHLPYTVFMAKQSFIDKNEATIQKFTNALHRAQKWVEESSIEEIADAVAPFFEDTEREIIESVVKRYKEQGSFAGDPIIDEGEWNNLLDVIESAGELKERVPHSVLVNNEFAEKAIKSVK